MTQRFLALSAILLLFAACDQSQDSPENTAPADEPAQIIKISTESGAQIATPDDQTVATQSTDHSLACDNDFSEAEGFNAFLTGLTNAVTTQDAAFIMDMLDENIKYSFGGDSGKANFIAEWRLDSTPESSPFWEVMGEVLRLGGYTQVLGDGETTVIFPCAFQELPLDTWLYAASDTLSAYDYMVVVREDAELKDDTGKTFRPLAYGEIVKRAAGAEDRFTTHDGLAGTIDAKAIRSPLDYRAFFQRKDGEWKMPLFIAGD